MLGRDDKKQWTVLYREQGLESEQGSDSKHRYKTNDHEIEAQLIPPACSLCALVSLCVYVCEEVQTVCVKAVSWSQIAASSLLCWGDLVGTGCTDRGSCVCVVVCLCMCMDLWVFVAALSDQPWLCPLRVCVNQGWPFSLCVPGIVCVYVRVRVRCCRQGKSLSSLCQRVGGDTPFICVWVSLFHSGSSPSEQEGPVFCIGFIRLHRLSSVNSITRQMMSSVDKSARPTQHTLSLFLNFVPIGPSYTLWPLANLHFLSYTALHAGLLYCCNVFVDESRIGKFDN